MVSSDSAFGVLRPSEDIHALHTCVSVQLCHVQTPVSGSGNTCLCCDRAPHVTVVSSTASEPASTRSQVISQLMERSEEATQQARELAAEAEQLQVRFIGPIEDLCPSHAARQSCPCQGLRRGHDDTGCY